MISSYAELVDLIRHTLAKQNLQDRIADWIWLAECEAQRKLDLPMTEKFKRNAFDITKDYVELPDDCVEMRFLKVLSSPTRNVRIATPDETRAVEASALGSGSPICGYITGNRFYYQPLSGDQYEMLYVGSDVVHLGKDQESNYLLRVGPDFLLYAALVHSAPFLAADERLGMWLSLAARAEDSMMAQASRLRTSGGPLVIRSDGGHP